MPVYCSNTANFANRTNWKVADYEAVMTGKKQLVPLTLYIK